MSDQVIAEWHDQRCFLAAVNEYGVAVIRETTTVPATPDEMQTKADDVPQPSSLEVS